MAPLAQTFYTVPATEAAFTEYSWWLRCSADAPLSMFWYSGHFQTRLKLDDKQQGQRNLRRGEAGCEQGGVFPCSLQRSLGTVVQSVLFTLHHLDGHHVSDV